ncbi:MAG: hypothetical protein IPL79_13855 [Myxococcales bacterium]|nr:hypothetical protein [Myxococcales bacterium]
MRASHRVKRTLQHATRAAARMWRDQGSQNVRAIIGVACAMLLLVVALVCRRPLGQALTQLEASSQMVIYLSPYVEDDVGQRLADKLAQRGGVVGSEFVSRDATRARLLDAFRGHEAVLSELDSASLPASIELRFAPGIADVIPASPLPAELRALPEVAELTFVGRDDHALTPALAAAAQASASIGWLLALLALGVAIISLRFGTVDLRREASVIELLGGPQRMWRAPAILIGGLQGLVGAGFALIIGYWLTRALFANLLHTYPALGDLVSLRFLTAGEMVGVLMGATVLGMVVAATAVRSLALSGTAWRRADETSNAAVRAQRAGAWS